MVDTIKEPDCKKPRSTVKYVGQYAIMYSILSFFKDRSEHRIRLESVGIVWNDHIRLLLVNGEEDQLFRQGTLNRGVMECCWTSFRYGMKDMQKVRC